MPRSNWPLLLIAALLAWAPGLAAEVRRLELEVVDAESRRPLPCRVYIRGDDGKWYFPASAAAGGSAIEYRKQNRNNPNSVEMHTSLSAHAAAVDLEPGSYTITVERGKEYLPATRRVTIGARDVALRIPLRRWIDMAALGWYSGDTHVHRELKELPNILLAEDLNVALPLSYWIRDAFRAPSGGGDPASRPEPRAIQVDERHIIYPVNTEYEIFTVGGKRHTLGAVFVLNHRSVFEEGVPPLGPVAERARREGALFELDKHNWPWSMAIVPVLEVDLYELSNNHVWRADFAFKSFGEPAADYMRVERDENGFTERGWLEFGFQNYYTLLNCGYRLRPTAGTASGVHPVPLGFGRVYVKVDGPFRYEKWIEGLDAGRSFVTTGPMLLATIGGEDVGQTFRISGEKTYTVEGRVESVHELERLELVVNGEIARSLPISNTRREDGTRETRFRTELAVSGSSWIALRCFSSTGEGRPLFAHSAPSHIEVEGRPLRPRRVEVEYLMKRVSEQIERSGSLLPESARREYSRALEAYRELLDRARPGGKGD